VFEHHSTLITQTITFTGENKFIYMLGHLGGITLTGNDID